MRLLDNNFVGQPGRCTGPGNEDFQSGGYLHVPLPLVFRIFAHESGEDAVSGRSSRGGEAERDNLRMIEQDAVRRWAQTWKEFGPELEKIRLREIRGEDNLLSLRLLASAFAVRSRVLLLKSANGPGLELRTCSAEDLVVMKLFASRAIDIRDAEGVSVRHGNTLDWHYVEEQLAPLAEAKEDPEILHQLARIRKLGTEL